MKQNRWAVGRSKRWATLALILIGISASFSQPIQNAAAISAGAAGTAPKRAQVDPNDPAIQYAFIPIVTQNLNQPLFVTYSNAGDGRLFIVEQTGKIKIWQNGQVLGQPFLDLGTVVNCCGERGLLGLAFEPNYTQTGRFYVYYINDNGDIVIARYTVSGNPNVAQTTGQVLLTIPHPDESNHNGGWLGFGPDGFLYAGVGDGGSGGNGAGSSAGNDSNINRCSAQRPENRTGKLLRLKVQDEATYTTPDTNAFVSGQAPEVWAIGLRNPWRNSFDRQTGELYIADVGQGAHEEVNVIPANASAGLNFGWPQREGQNDYGNEFGCADSGRTRTEPFADYSHSLGSSITGGYVYRGQLYSVINGVYFYGDYATGRIWAAWHTTPGGPLQTAEIANTNFAISSFGEDANGEIYVVDYNGRVYQLAALYGLNQHVYLPKVRR